VVRAVPAPRIEGPGGLIGPLLVPRPEPVAEATQ
jgi:hypothetical protein